VLVQSRLNTSEAVARLEAEGSPHAEVRGLIEFIRGARRGVILKRHIRHRFRRGLKAGQRSQSS